MAVNLYLESQKNSIATTVILQNAMKEQNQNYNDSFDVVSSKVSIFSVKVNAEIREKASQCNNISNQILYEKGKAQNELGSSVSDINGKVEELQSLVNWAGSVSQDLANTPGISDTAITSIQQNMGETVKLGESLVRNSVAQASEVLEKVSTPENETIVKEAKQNISEITHNTIDATDEKVSANDKSLVPTNETPVADITKTTPNATATQDTETATVPTTGVPIANKGAAVETIGQLTSVLQSNNNTKENPFISANVEVPSVQETPELNIVSGPLLNVGQ